MLEEDIRGRSRFHPALIYCKTDAYIIGPGDVLELKLFDAPVFPVRWVSTMVLRYCR